MLERQRVERERLLPRLAREITWVCLNCGARSSAVAAIPVLPTAAEVAGANAEVEGDPAASDKLRFQVHWLTREHADAVAAERAAFDEFRVAHVLCPADRAQGLPEPPPWDGTIRVWSGPVALPRG